MQSTQIPADSASTPGTDRHLPLAGIRVIDFTAFMAGPQCARWLGDLGAEVIKIEPVGGESQRTRPPMADSCSRYFGHMNSGKRSVALDLKNPDAIEIAKKLCLESDVVLEAFRPGVMKRLGLGGDAMREANPRLTYCSISGFGQNTSASNLPAFASIIHATSGLEMANFEYQDGLDRPPNSGIMTADLMTSVFAAFSVQTALYERERTGRGRTIDVTLMDSIMNLMVYEFQVAQFPQANRRWLFKPLRAKDGFLNIAPVTQNNFRALCKCIGHPEWLDDARFNTDLARYANWDAYLGGIEAWTSQRPAQECEQVMMSAGVPCARYRTVTEAIADPQFEERRSFATVHDDAGSFRTTNLPFMLDGWKPQAGGRVPNAGEDTRWALGHLLGIQDAEIDRLAAAGAVGC